MDTALPRRLWSLTPQAIVGLGLVGLALLTTAASWLWGPGKPADGVGAVDVLLSIGLGSAVVAAYQFPLHSRPRTKLYMASVPYYLLAALAPPALAAVAAGLGALGGELSVRAQRRTSGGQIATEVGRRGIVVVLAALMAHRPGPDDAPLHALALGAAALVLGVGDIATFPLLFIGTRREPLLRFMLATARDAWLVEGVQYLLGLLGALAAAQQLWAPALLLPPTALVYVALKQAHDLQERERKARVQAEEAVHLRDDFLMAASHELRTPLTAIQGFAELIHAHLASARSADAEWLDVHLHRLSEGVARMADTVDDIIDMARLQAGQRLALHVELVDLSAVVRTIAADITASAAGAKAAPVILEMPVRGSVAVQGDRRRLERTIHSVIDNAITHSPRDAAVHVALRREGAWALVCVRYQDAGLSAEEICDGSAPFNGARARGAQGSGIGLAGAKTIVEQHGGHIAAESAGEGHETTVLVRLPCLDAAVEAVIVDQVAGRS